MCFISHPEKKILFMASAQLSYMLLSCKVGSRWAELVYIVIVECQHELRQSEGLWNFFFSVRRKAKVLSEKSSMRWEKSVNVKMKKKSQLFLLFALQVLSSPHCGAKIESLRAFVLFFVLELLGLRPTRPDSLTHFQQRALCSGSLVTSLVISTKQLIDKLPNIIQISTQNKTFSSSTPPFRRFSTIFHTQHRTLSALARVKANDKIKNKIFSASSSQLLLIHETLLLLHELASPLFLFCSR